MRLGLPVAALRKAAGEATGGEEGERHRQEAQRLPAALGDSLGRRKALTRRTSGRPGALKSCNEDSNFSTSVTTCFTECLTESLK